MDIETDIEFPKNIVGNVLKLLNKDNYKITDIVDDILYYEGTKNFIVYEKDDKLVALIFDKINLSESCEEVLSPIGWADLIISIIKESHPKYEPCIIIFYNLHGEKAIIVNEKGAKTFDELCLHKVKNMDQLLNLES
ncbi:NEQ193 [Nanoarchaeum equitans Kin4-M]|uniref:NEQ193 n=1 Tax=Nanoarchaeum equitans (strain Kin4-M) TaxID=228908 RepID=Q74NC5_NANEQ|nr:NEQ193 [Nanoarchaeum equitans Kin4-M]